MCWTMKYRSRLIIDIVAKYEPKLKNRKEKNDSARISMFAIGENLGNKELILSLKTKLLLKIKNKTNKAVPMNIAAFKYLSLVNKKIAGTDKIRLVNTIYCASVKRLKAESFLLRPLFSKSNDLERKLHIFPGV